MDSFLHGFSTAFQAMLQLGIIVAVSGILARKKVFSEDMVAGMTKGVVYCFLPCLIFDKITHNFHPGEMEFWWVIPLSALGMFLLGLGFTVLLNPREMKLQPDLLPLGFMQNAGYLSLAVGKVMVPDRFDQWAVYTFLYILVFNPLLWTFGKYFVSHDSTKRFQFRGIITPPLVGNILGVTLVLTGVAKWIPFPVSESVHLLGSAAVPVSMVILGATLATTPFSVQKHLGLVTKSFITKLLLLPAAVMGILLAYGLPKELEMLGLFWILQAAYPQASNLILQIRTYGGSRERVCAVLVICYIGSLVTLPFWVGLWQNLR